MLCDNSSLNTKLEIPTYAPISSNFHIESGQKKIEHWTMQHQKSMKPAPFHIVHFPGTLVGVKFMTQQNVNSRKKVEDQQWGILPQLFMLSILNTLQHDTHFHQRTITTIVGNPLHHRIQINSATPMKSNTSKTHNLQVNKTTKCEKKTKEIELSASTTLHDAQPSHSLSPFAFHPCHFRFFTSHPS